MGRCQPLRGGIEAGWPALIMADWTRSAVMRCLTSGQAYCGPLRLTPGLGKASRMLTGDSLGSHSLASGPPRYSPDPGYSPRSLLYTLADVWRMAPV